MIEQYLERLFTWESLENTERGVEFEMKNRLIESEFDAVTTIAIDGERVADEDITFVVREDEHYTADEITPESPLALDLAETVQVVLDRPRLRLGVHEITVGLSVDGYGEVDFTTDDEITEDDLVDVDPADRTVAELEALAADVTEPRTFERLLERERDGKNRKTAVELLDEGLERAEPLTEAEMVHAEPTEKTASGGGIVDELLVDILESPQRVSVYLTVQTLGSGRPDEIANRMVLSESTVESTLEGLEREGLADRDAEGQYSVAGPITVLQKRQQDLWSVLRSAL